MLCVSSCRCCVFVSGVILSAVFCVICSLLTFVSDASGDHTAGQHHYSRHTCRHHHNSGNQAHPQNLTPKVHNFTTVQTDRLHKAGGGLITLIRYNITLTTTDIPSTINTHNTELQMVKVHMNNTKHITITNLYIPPRDSTSTHYKTADTDIQHCIQYITNIPPTQSSPEM